MSKSNTGKDATDSSGLAEAPNRSGVYRAMHDPDGPATVSDTVIEAVAAVADVDPTTTLIPLSERIDPDALDGLFVDGEGDVQLSFTVCGLEVLVRSDGRIRIVDDSVAEPDRGE